MAVRLMVLQDEETCTGVEDCAVIEFANEFDADDFADYGSDVFELRDTGIMVEVPLKLAVRKMKEIADA